MNLREFAGATAAILISMAGLGGFAAAKGAGPRAGGSVEIKPFKAHIADSVLNDLKRRLAQARWPDQLPGTTWEYGADINAMHKLADYWQRKFDWRAQEARINRFEQFTTEIEGQQIHFIHHRSSRPNAIPLMLVHGWPGSMVEFLALIEPLAEPKDPNSPAFHVVVPSLPGFGFSGPTTSTGWDPRRMARALITLMDRLGYSRYGLQGGDWGSVIVRHMAVQAPAHVLGLHVNFLPVPPPSPKALAELSDEERRRFTHYQDEEAGYFELQQTRPQTAAYGLSDSPLGLLAWMGEKFHAWTDNSADFLTVDRDTLLTNVTLYWVTGTIGSSMRIYREYKLAGGNSAPLPRTEVPVGYAVFPKEIIASPYRWIEQVYNITQRTEMPKGGHFAALEQPELLIKDVRAFFAKLRL
jgi:pimeloyl-ACP methyl ester carboxylesterase